MDAAEYGVIYLSLGSFIELNKVENLGKEFIRVMENLPQRVVMKWDLSLLPYVPENFFVQDWLPQESILSKKIYIHVYDNIIQKGLVGWLYEKISHEI